MRFFSGRLPIFLSAFGAISQIFRLRTRAGLGLQLSDIEQILIVELVGRLATVDANATTALAGAPDGGVVGGNSDGRGR